MGLGVKYGVTSNLTLDVTLNPDFSQIESDQPQVEVNQRFALFYPGQRPFFLEGQEIFAAATPGQPGAHAHDRRPALRSQALREGRRRDARRVRDRRRGYGRARPQRRFQHLRILSGFARTHDTGDPEGQHDTEAESQTAPSGAAADSLRGVDADGHLYRRLQQDQHSKNVVNAPAPRTIV